VKGEKNVKNKVRLAWSLLSEICANLVEYLKKILHSKVFVNQHKKSEKDFTRERGLPFETMFLYFINFIKGSCQDELDHYFKAFSD